MKKLFILLLLVPILVGCSGEVAGTPRGSVNSTTYLDNTKANFGTSDDAWIVYDGTDWLYDAAVADEGLKFGDTSTGFDLTYYFETAGTITTDYDGDNMAFSDDMDLVFGTGDDITIEYDEDGTDKLLITGNTYVNGTFNYKSEIEKIAATPETLTAAETGKVAVSNYTGTLTVNLPAAAAGLTFTVVDNSATAADDVIVDIDAGDNIEGDTNGDGLICTDDAVGSSVTLVAVDDARWIVLSTTGTWAAQ
jgi:hypothetical protein